VHLKTPTKERFDLFQTFALVDDGGNVKPVGLTRSFWSNTSARYHRVVGAFDFRSNEDLHSTMQEMHPQADELLFVLTGAIDVMIEELGVERSITLRAGQATIVPRGRWHRLVMRKPGKLLFVNSRSGMRSRKAPSSSRRQCSPRQNRVAR
jgi:mannose-6-phosphate isomerase-like protein (cupin superfamily)